MARLHISVASPAVHKQYNRYTTHPPVIMAPMALIACEPSACRCSNRGFTLSCGVGAVGPGGGNGSLTGCSADMPCLGALACQACNQREASSPILRQANRVHQRMA